MKIKTTLNFWNTAKTVLSGKVMALNARNRKEEIWNQRSKQGIGKCFL